MFKLNIKFDLFFKLVHKIGSETYMRFYLIINQFHVQMSKIVTVI